jgi:hypothetical protein
MTFTFHDASARTKFSPRSHSCPPGRLVRNGDARRGHDQRPASSGIAARPCKKRKDGAATCHYGKGRTERGEGGPAPTRIVEMRPSGHMSRKSFSKKISARVRELWFNVTLFFRFHWFPLFLIALVSGIAGYWTHYLLPSVNYQSAQWAVSTEVESLATLLGITLVGVTILWSQATGEEARLRELRPKYYELLRTGGNPNHTGIPVIEKLRVDYLKKIRARTLPRQVFQYEHSKYHTHRDLFVDICRLSEVVHEYCGMGKIFETLESDLKGLRFPGDEITDKILVTWYDLKSDASQVLGLVNDIISPGNATVYFELEGGQELADKIWDLTLLQHTETSLDRVARFKQFRSVWFRLGFGIYVVAIVTGLLAVSATTREINWQPLFIGSMILGFASIVFTICFVHALVRSN